MQDSGHKTQEGWIFSPRSESRTSFICCFCCLRPAWGSFRVTQSCKGRSK